MKLSEEKTTVVCNLGHKDTEFDEIAKPKHYNSHKSGVESIEVARAMSFRLGNAFKYLFRRNLKEAEPKDIAKAVWYVRDTILNPYPDEDKVDENIAKVTVEEPIHIGLAMSLIYSADKASCQEAKLSMLQQALSLLEMYQQEIECQNK